MEEVFKSPIDMVNHWAKIRKDSVYLRQPIDGKYKDYSWKEVQSLIYIITGFLDKMGLKSGDRVAILSKNCAEWFIVDLALMYGGYVSVPIYPTANADTIGYVLEHSESKAIFVGKLDYWQSQEEAIHEGILRFALPYETMPSQFDWEDVIAAEPINDLELPKADQDMTILYTSGSTGVPKGAIQKFYNYAWTCAIAVEWMDFDMTDRFISYLPLAHITERVAVQGSSIYCGGVVGFVETLDSFVEDVQRAKPTMFFSVPRLWSIFQKNIFAKVSPNLLKFLLKVPLINFIVKRKLKKELGLNYCTIIGSGSAPISPSLVKWYFDLGINISEGWGMTENCAFSIINYPFNPKKIGTVGRAIPGCTVKFSDQGELLIKSPNLLSGYYKDEEQTKSSFTEDGFFKTGDLGSIDSDGYISITGRIKDNFKTAKGKYVSPIPIEKKITQDVNVELVCVIGAGMSHPSALVQLSENSYKQNRDLVRTSLKSTLDSVNATLESHEMLDSLLITTKPWTTENGVLTPTLKIKRHVLEEQFSDKLEQIKDVVVWEDEI